MSTHLREIVLYTIYLSATLFIFGSLNTTVCALNTFTVVLDAGHGGKDPGAIGKKLKEKDINLDIVKKLGALIKNENPNVKVIYTRSTDVFVELSERAKIANRNHADLFISVHTNAAKAKTAYGTETYALGLARTEENLSVAKRENSVILLEDDYAKKYEGFDPTSSESYIMFDLMQGMHLEQSINLASLVQDQFEGGAGRTDRGVRQAGFWVLRATAMPSILIEVGYISNPDEERYLSSDEGKTNLAKSIYKAFSSYKSDWDRKQNSSIDVVRGTSGKNKKPVVENAAVNKKEDGSKLTKAEQKTEVQPKENIELKDNAPKKKQPVVSVTDNTLEGNSINTYQKENQKTDLYKVQLMALPKLVNVNSTIFKGLTPVNYYTEKGFYKYTYGAFSDKEEAVKEASRLQSAFKGAFVVHFVDGVKVNY